MKAKKLLETFNRRKSEWYNLRPILGYSNWAIFYLLLGGREIGKSYSVTNFFVDQFVHNGTPFTWLRLTDAAAGKLLANNAEKLVDPDLRRKYNLDLVTSGNNVYSVEREDVIVKHKNGTTTTKKVITKKTLMARVYAISTFYNDKGSIFDKDFLKTFAYYNVAVDEFQREKNEKNTFDIIYALVNQLENLLRSTKEKVRIFFLGNTLEEASDVLCAFNFIPEKFGIFKLKKKRCVIHNIEPSEAYLKRRQGTIADILLPQASTFTNKVKVDDTLVLKKKLKQPKEIIKFSKDEEDWFTLWNDNIIAPYHKEACSVKVAMRPYLDEKYILERVKNVFSLFDYRQYRYKDLITFKRFQKNMQLLKPRS